MVNFLEQIEAAEEFDTSPHDKTVAKKKGSSVSFKKKENDNSGSRNKKHCDEHGWNYTHTTAECKVINGGGKKPKTSGYQKKPYGNKSWNRNKSDESTGSSKKELAAFIKKTIKAGVQKELNATNKKRSKDDSDDDLDLNAFEENIEDFNYKEMDDLKIDSDDEVSV